MRDGEIKILPSSSRSRVSGIELESIEVRRQRNMHRKNKTGDNVKLDAALLSKYTSLLPCCEKLAVEPSFGD